jgi:cardiolipin synthase
VDVRGPVVEDIHRVALETVERAHGLKRRRRLRPELAATPEAAGDMKAMFVTRDNSHHRSDIERHYRAAIASARERLIIANAYFFPPYGLLRELSRAARRGVDVRLVLQGEPDLAIARFAARLLYDYLMQSGIRIFEYCRRPFHGKVAVADDEWVTVGSSNLDPLSLAFNLEANLIVRDVGFGRHVRARLETLMRDDCSEVRAAAASRRIFWRPLLGAVVFHLLRHFPQWARWLPARDPVLTRKPPETRERVVRRRLT